MSHFVYVAFLLVLLAGCSGSSADDGWTRILDPADLSYWQHIGPGEFVQEDGVLRSEGGMGLLWYTRDMIGDAKIRVVYRTETPEANSGVFIRIPSRPIEPWMPVMRGYEVQINDAEDDFHRTGVLYSLTRARARPGRVGAWNTMEITLNGFRTIVEVNGEVVTDYTEGDPVPEKGIWWEPDRGRRPLYGYIGIQNHGPEDTVYVREISIRPLDD